MGELAGLSMHHPVQLPDWSPYKVRSSLDFDDQAVLRVPMEFDRFSVGFLTTKSGAPERSDVENDAIQDADMS
jgi:hypothetical protein